jgi:hypothetical protein
MTALQVIEIVRRLDQGMTRPFLVVNVPRASRLQRPALAA